jgi:hypothetical protein
MTLKPSYTTYQQSNILKDKGYDLPCLHWWFKDSTVSVPTRNGNNKRENWNNFSTGLRISAPEQHEVVEWLRIEKSIWVSVKRDYHNGALLGFESMIDNEDGFIDCGTFDTPQEAYSAAFDYIFKELI